MSVKLKNLYQGFFRLMGIEAKYRFCDGSIVKVFRECLDVGAAAVVLPYDPKLKKVLMIQQFRAAIAIDEDIELDGFFDTHAYLEFPAGMVDLGESPREAGLRELYEETGIKACALESAGSFYPSLGYSSEKIFFFLAAVDLSAISDAYLISNTQENIRCLLFSVEDIFKKNSQSKFKILSTSFGINILKNKFN